MISPLRYESVFARHYTRASAAEYGVLNMLLPFVTVLVTPIVCSMADRYRSHRSFFTISLISTLISFCLHSMLPLLLEDRPRHPAPGGQLLLGPWIFYCLICLMSNISMGINTCLSDSFAVLQAEEQGTSFGRIIVWGTFGWALSALIQGFANQATFLPRLVPGLLLGSLLLAIDAINVSLWRKNSDFKLDTIPVKAAQALTSSSSSLHREPSDYQPQNESALINLGMKLAEEEHILKRQTKSPVKMMLENEQLPEPTATAAAAKETATSDLSNTDDFSGSSSITIGQPDSNTNKLQNPERAEKKAKSEDQTPNCASFKIQLVMLWFILKRRLSLVRFLILFIMSGFFMSMHWNYFFLFLEELHGGNFEIVTAFSMICQSIIGELPFFILSRKMIEFFGRSHTLSMVFMSMGVRFLLYAYFLPNVSAWYLVIVADCFQGPNYGLFYVVMTEVGLEYSYCDDETVDMLSKRGDLDASDKRQVDSVRLLLKSTIQSVAFACYEGIGLGLGSMVGGFILVNYRFRVLWTLMAAGAFLVGLINTAIEFNSCDRVHDEERSDRREFVEANAKGLIERVASPAPLRAAPNDRQLSSDPAEPKTPANKQQQGAQKNHESHDDLSPRFAMRRTPPVLARKSAGGPLAPPAANVTYKQRAKKWPAPQTAHPNN